MPTDHGVGIGIAGRRRNFSYHRLPEQRLNLSVLKLDGSSFAVQVARAASVLQLKLAVEEVFSRSPKDGEGEISWSHVWGHFCLCYNDRKLVDDNAQIKTFGIKDGDQLHFIRCISVNCRAIQRRSRNHGAALEHHKSMAGPEAMDTTDEFHKDDNTSQYNHACDGNTEHTTHTKSKASHSFRGWFNSKLSSGRTSSERRPSRPRGSFLDLMKRNSL